IDDRPTTLLGLVERLVECAYVGVAIISVLALGVRMMHEAQEARSGARCRVLEHGVIAIRISKGKDGTTTNEAVDSDRLAIMVVNELDLCLFDEPDCSVCRTLELDDARRAYDLLRRDRVNIFGEHAHEFDAAT